jgi:hypothetical protein
MPSETPETGYIMRKNSLVVNPTFSLGKALENIGKTTVNESFGWKNHESFFLMLLHYPCVTLSNSLLTHQEEPMKTYLSTGIPHRNSVVHWIGLGATFAETLRVWRRIYQVSVLDVEW